MVRIMRVKNEYLHALHRLNLLLLHAHPTAHAVAAATAVRCRPWWSRAVIGGERTRASLHVPHVRAAYCQLKRRLGCA